MSPRSPILQIIPSLPKSNVFCGRRGSSRNTAIDDPVGVTVVVVSCEVRVNEAAAVNNEGAIIRWGESKHSVGGGV